MLCTCAVGDATAVDSSWKSYPAGKVPRCRSQKQRIYTLPFNFLTELSRIYVGLRTLGIGGGGGGCTSTFLSNGFF